MTDPTQLTRAVANALWRYLRKRHWKPATTARSLSPTGAPRSHHYSGGGHIPGPEPTIEILDYDPYLRVIATADETRLGHGLAIHLTRRNTDRALSALLPEQIADYEEALNNPQLKIQKPFTWKGDRYRRNELLTRPAARALEAVAAAADITPLTPEQEASLTEDDQMRPNEVFAAIQRSNVKS